MIYKILYYGEVKIKIDARIYMKFGDGITKVLEKAFELIPKKAYSDGLIAIIMGFSKKLVTVGKTSCYDKSSIYISGDFLKYEKFHGVLLRELVHELGHAFIESWKDNLFSDKNLYSDFALLKKKIKERFQSSQIILLKITALRTGQMWKILLEIIMVSLSSN